ncbi:hypothetical protein DPM19_16255 [Actinomadura craniellae]|uniref:Uncharacterized protein n=1 Tax=Actinomadura craniellae TaxID=2231787 RepID=A0A365H4E3_9ACTN|nr:hypothetical protein [Actinomadura craniellae]RAY13862.1 hypothetical protein DPM19_16255 [Actinomadura craniellae]
MSGDGAYAPADRSASRESSGDARVDAALGRLDELAGRPVAEHVEIFEDVHQRLQDVLVSADQEGEPA